MMHFSSALAGFLALLLSGFYGAFLYGYVRSAGYPLVRRRLWKTLAVHAAACGVLIFAAAGPLLNALSRDIQIVVAADVSDSIFYLPTQSSRMAELVAALDRRNCEVGVVVFGGTAATERPLLPLPEHDELQTGRTRSNAAHPSAGAARDGTPPLPPLEKEKRSSVIDTSSTDIGGALDYARNLLPDRNKSRAILLLSDFRDTHGHADAAAAALSGSGIDLLATPAILSTPTDAHIAAIHVPDAAQVGRSIPVEITVSALNPCTVRVEMWLRGLGAKRARYQSAMVELTKESGPPNSELRKTIRFLDTPEEPGIAAYATRIGSERGPASADPNASDTLSAAVRVSGPSRWAVLTHGGSTLAKLAAANGLGVAADVFEVGKFKTRGTDYKPYSGILVDGLSVKELPDPAVGAIADALSAGKGLVTVGGEQAYGAGEHQPDGKWESLLPVAMTPEDDRTRTVLFLIDISMSMADNMGDGRKIDFAEKQLSLAVQKLKPLDRVGLITFSDNAETVVELSSEPARAKFRDALTRIKPIANTDLLAPIRKAQEVLDKDDAEEQLIVLLSDGVTTTSTTDEEVLAGVRALTPEPAAGAGPRRRTVFTFGIDTGEAENKRGETLMKNIATNGGGKYFAEFARLAEQLEQAFDSQKKGFYKRRESFSVRATADHPLLASIGADWPALPFRNRVKAKPAAESLLVTAASQNSDQKGTRRPDPLLVISGAGWPGAARVASLALGWDGVDGAALLATPAGQKLLPALLEWAEARSDTLPEGWSLNADPRRDGALEVELRARDHDGVPVNDLKPHAQLTDLQSGKEPVEAELLPSAPGVYRALIQSPAAGRVHSLHVREGARILPERFVTIPFSAETTQLGVDRAAMQELVEKAGGGGDRAAGSRVIDRPEQLNEWVETKTLARSASPLAPWLLSLALALLLGLYLVRNSR